MPQAAQHIMLLASSKFVFIIKELYRELAPSYYQLLAPPPAALVIVSEVDASYSMGRNSEQPTCPYVGINNEFSGHHSVCLLYVGGLLTVFVLEDVVQLIARSDDNRTVSNSSHCCHYNGEQRRKK